MATSGRACLRALRTRGFIATLAAPRRASALAAAPSGTAAVDVVGRLEVFMGPMFAGKTTALLNRVDELEHGGARVVMLKSEKDNR